MVGVCVLTEALVELVEEVLRPAEAGGGDVMWRGVEGGSRGAWETPISLSEWDAICPLLTHHASLLSLQRQRRRSASPPEGKPPRRDKAAILHPLSSIHPSIRLTAQQQRLLFWKPWYLWCNLDSDDDDNDDDDTSRLCQRRLEMTREHTRSDNYYFKCDSLNMNTARINKK